MSTTNIFERFADTQGWNAASQREVLERYIDNQRDDEALVDYLVQAALEESVDTEGSDLEAIAADMGWDDQSIVFILLTYIQNHESDDVFEDFLHQQAELENSPSI